PRRRGDVRRHAARGRVVVFGSPAGAHGQADPLPGAGPRGRVHLLALPVRGPGSGGDVVSAARVGASELVDRVASIASDKKAIDIRVLDVREAVSYTDYFLICSGNTERQAKAIHDAVYEELKKD